MDAFTAHASYAVDWSCMNGNNALLTYEEASELDRKTQGAGFPETQLMGNAALASLHTFLSGPEFRRLIIVVGSGNNGGDGYALGFMFASAVSDWKERLIVLRASDRTTPAAAFYAEKLTSIGARIEDAGILRSLSPGPDDLLVEAVLGTGQKEPPRGRAAEILEDIRTIRNAPRKPRYASLDVPAGLSEDAGALFDEETPGALPLPDEIHCYGEIKLAVVLNPTLAAHSNIRRLPIGFLPGTKTFAESFPPVHLSEFRKTSDMHKYEAGHGLVIGGAAGMEGAALLAARSFFAAGGGILHALLVSRERADALRSEPSVMFVDTLDKVTRIPGAVGCGPGLGSEGADQIKSAYFAFLKRAAGSGLHGVVLDAAACTYALDPDFPSELRVRTILTPHAGEWKSIGGPAVACASDLKRAARWNAEKLGVWTLLKGSVSVLLPPGIDEPVRVHAVPNAGLATAGSGDCLTGVLTAALARTKGRVPETAALSVKLLDAAARQVTHPSASVFPELIRSVFGDSVDRIC